MHSKNDHEEGAGKAWQEALHLETAQASTNPSSDGQLGTGKLNFSAVW